MLETRDLRFHPGARGFEFRRSSAVPFQIQAGSRPASSRGDWIRTSDLLLPRQARSPRKSRPERDLRRRLPNVAPTVAPADSKPAENDDLSAMVRNLTPEQRKRLAALLLAESNEGGSK